MENYAQISVEHLYQIFKKLEIIDKIITAMTNELCVLLMKKHETEFFKLKSHDDFVNWAVEQGLVITQEDYFNCKNEPEEGTWKNINI